MRIGIYTQPVGGTLGGAEQCVGVLAEAASEGGHQVEIIHHHEGLTRDRLAAHCGTDLSRVTVRAMPQKTDFGAGAFWKSRRWFRDLSGPYDLFVIFTHAPPPFCHARRGVLVVLFPNQVRPGCEPDGAVGKGTLRRLYQAGNWNARFRGYDSRVAISEFTRRWSKSMWGIECRVIAPPVNTDVAPAVKRDAILSVGRFTATGHSKKQREMVAAFTEMQPGLPPDWTYWCAGGLGDRPPDQAYFGEVCRAAQGSRAELLPNLERAKLEGLFATAKVFWHAAGYGEDADSHPEMMEHFGITTVEAMAAGCVPVVINQGGQPELVEHGVSGFVWETLEELGHYTRLLAQDGPLCARMSAAARDRAQRYSRPQYVAQYMRLLGLGS